MTQRTRWLILLAVLGFGLGILRGQSMLALLSLSVLLWIYVEWLLFYWRVWRECPELKIVRRLNGNAGEQGYLWSGRRISVQVEVTAARGTLGPLVTFRDCLEENLRVVDGPSVGVLVQRSAGQTWNYTVEALGAGDVFLPGFHVTFQDHQGFFNAERFVAVPQRFRVLPQYAVAGDIQPRVKRMNSLPQHGIHRMQRAGMGSELLELREYVPGDPPKSIAWKVSARRGSLMTRQYESEVPVRLVLFIDGSIGTRLGGFGRRLLDQMNFVAASVTRTAISAGDPVGLVLFDERGTSRIPASGGERGFYNVLKNLAEFSTNPAPPGQRLTQELVLSAIRICHQRYPELMDPRINRVPFSLFPLSPWERRRHYQRSLLAGALAEIYQLPPQQMTNLIYDDSRMAWYAQSMLNEAGLAWMSPMIQTRNRGFHDGMATMQLLSKALTDCVSVARDNEVYVILANLLECATNIAHLMPAVRMALARHHRVIVVCPTPTFRRPQPDSFRQEVTAENLLKQAEDIRLAELSLRLRRTLCRAGAAVSISGEQQAIRMILSETQLARTGRVSAAGAARS
ncbi:MAG: DUF58 domain-containing protein [Planctomycetaceae bacterium]|nr:DUF58 domain-containing protein [Planctomycetaceae bacterium]